MSYKNGREMIRWEKRNVMERDKRIREKRRTDNGNKSGINAKFKFRSGRNI